MFAVALGATASVKPRLGLLALIAVLFTLGMLLGIRRLGGTLTSGVMLARPVHVVTAELSAAAAVLGSTAVGAPVSMTQSITAALVGTGIKEGYGRGGGNGRVESPWRGPSRSHSQPGWPLPSPLWPPPLEDETFYGKRHPAADRQGRASLR